MEISTHVLPYLDAKLHPKALFQITFEVRGLAFWAYGDKKYPPGRTEVATRDRELAQAIFDAHEAKVGVTVLEVR
jgi:hypothetical protein